MKLKSNTKIVLVLGIMLMAICLFNTTSVQAHNEFVGIKVGSVTMVENGEVLQKIEGVTYDKTTNTLTLNNYSGTYIKIGNMGKDFKIKVVGTNTLSEESWTLCGALGGEFTDESMLDSITFTGAGTLNIAGDVAVVGNITLNGATVNVKGYVRSTGFKMFPGSGTMTIQSGKLEVNNGIQFNYLKNSDSMIYTDKNSNRLYVAEYEEGEETVKTICNTKEYSEESIVKHIIFRVANKVKEEDSTTGIKLEATETQLPANTKATIEEVTTGNTFNTVKTVLKDSTNKMKIFEITLKSNDVEIQPNGKIKISIPIPEGFDTSKLMVYRIEENGTKTEYTVTVNGNYATFETDHFSTYALAEVKQEDPTVNTNTDNKNTNKEKDITPKTGVTTPILVIAFVTMIAGIGIVAVKKNQK